jgi:hypothetical protein
MKLWKGKMLVVVLLKRECLVYSKFGLADGIVARQYIARNER